MAFFGNTLIEKGLISQENLLDALVEQSNLLPSPIQIVHEQALLNPNRSLMPLPKEIKEKPLPRPVRI